MNWDVDFRTIPCSQLHDIISNMFRFFNIFVSFVHDCKSECISVLRCNVIKFGQRLAKLSRSTVGLYFLGFKVGGLHVLL